MQTAYAEVECTVAVPLTAADEQKYVLEYIHWYGASSASCPRN